MTTLPPSTETTANVDLFSDWLESITPNHIEIIETVISSLDSDRSAMVSHSDGGYLWKFNYGSVEVFVQLTGLTDEDTFTVWASVLKLPAKNEPQLMRALLEMNWSATFEARFAILDDQVVVLTSRTLAELSPSEISRSVTVVASIADNNDDDLQAEFSQA
ncbi:hypothetical protein DO97_00270 [Neosynechococcus sphagnicola sy1]|uniref:YbjN domain-containing protein n=1 Tax=Neosynechococcus sphagnicola sy1 TaxID=1497020 RepID=A0A098TNY3_9CYAN|nr:YbjN domain-containing protein [Neosynechococcus sphagnicola]KGF74004.1 hypothetical protein DO97_00270 [Neosynechococcus sphagnicola sy1]